jgi:hypothetical protein
MGAARSRYFTIVFDAKARRASIPEVKSDPKQLTDRKFFRTSNTAASCGLHPDDVAFTANTRPPNTSPATRRRRWFTSPR